MWKECESKWIPMLYVSYYEQALNYLGKNGKEDPDEESPCFPDSISYFFWDFVQQQHCIGFIGQNL